MVVYIPSNTRTHTFELLIALFLHFFFVYSCYKNSVVFREKSNHAFDFFYPFKNKTPTVNFYLFIDPMVSYSLNV